MMRGWWKMRDVVRFATQPLWKKSDATSSNAKHAPHASVVSESLGILAINFFNERRVCV